MSNLSDPTKDAESPEWLAGTVELPQGMAPYIDLVAHAQGGLGEVFRGTDPALNRTVAVKRLQERLADRVDCRRRFLIEAEITARLEHPGVVPVYGLFNDSGDRPVYAMRFIEGRTLSDVIQSYHGAPADPFAFRRLLLAFLQVCQTVAYAHNRGVLHRDLKPQNIMLGKFGETLVVDWGLAKVVGRPDEVKQGPAAEATLIPASGAGDETAMGSAVGTPAYMSPEQAAGRWNVIDQRSDVYGLGAVLYTLLTGKPPLAKCDWPEMQQKIQRGDFPRPRQLKPDVPRSLEAICLKAMAIRPDDRYSSVAFLAEDVEHWLADEAVSAYPEPMLVRGRRWMRRHRTLVTAAAIVLVTALAAAGAGLALLGQKNRQIVAERNAAQTAADEAEAVNAFLTDDLLGQADPDVNSRDRKVTVETVLAKAAASINETTRFADKPLVEAALRLTIGKTYFKLGEFRQAESHLRRALELRRAHLSEDDTKTLIAQRELGWFLDEAGKTDEAGPLLKQTWEAFSRVLGPDDVQTLGTHGEYALVLRDTDHFPEAEDLLQQNLTLAERRHGWSEYITLEAANNLGVVLTDQGKWSEAESLLRKALPFSRDIRGKPNLLPVLNNLSRALLFLGRLAEAEKFAREGVEESRRIKGEIHIHTLHLNNQLAEILIENGRLDEGARLARECLEERRKALPARHPNLGRSLIILGRALAQKGDAVSAEPILAEAEEVFRGAQSKQPYLAQAMVWRGVCLLVLNRTKEATPLLDAGFPTLKTHPMVTRAHPVQAADKIATLFQNAGDDERAQTWRKEAADLRKVGRLGS